MEEIRLRDATPTDVPSICAIHNQGIEDRVATLDVDSHTLEEQMAWFHRHGPRHPVIVAESSAGIIGWAALNQFSPRPAYRFVVDLSVYIERQWRGQGVGTRLYERFGFRTVGIYREQGLFDGRWVDTMIMEKLLAKS